MNASFWCGLLSLSTSVSLGERIWLKTWEQIRQIFCTSFSQISTACAVFHEKYMGRIYTSPSVTKRTDKLFVTQSIYISGLFAQFRLARMSVSDIVQYICNENMCVFFFLLKQHLKPSAILWVHGYIRF